MCLKTRKDLLPFFTEVDNKKISSISHLVSTITGFNVQPNKAIVGKMLLLMNLEFIKMVCSNIVIHMR